MSSVLLEARAFRPFKSSEEYLYAMKEDLAEWFQTLYPHLRISVDNFLDRLETGVALCEVCFSVWLFVASLFYFYDFFYVQGVVNSREIGNDKRYEVA